MPGSQIPKQRNRDHIGLRKNLRKLAGQKMGTGSSPTFGTVKLNDLTTSRLVWTNASKVLTSIDLATIVAGTANRVTVTDDGDGTITLTGPQDIHSGASPTFVTVTLSNLTASKLVATDGSKGLVSADANSFITGTANQVVVTDDGDGTVTLSTPQDIHTAAEPRFAGVYYTAKSLPATVEYDELIQVTTNSRLYFGRSK